MTHRALYCLIYFLNTYYFFVALWWAMTPQMHLGRRYHNKTHYDPGRAGENPWEIYKLEVNLAELEGVQKENVSLKKEAEKWEGTKHRAGLFLIDKIA